MSKLYISKQKIINRAGKAFAYELNFKDESNKPVEFSTHLKSNAKLILSSITSTELNKLLGVKGMAFINVDEATLSKGILDLLDKNRFILNILEDITLSEDVIRKIVTYKKKGFLLSLEHFDASARMIIKFKRLFNYIDIIKMDILLSESENLEKLAKKFQKTRIKLLAQGVECREDYKYCFDLGFDYFEGDFIDAPSIMEIKALQDPPQMIILHLIKLIKNSASTEDIEHYIRQQPDLSYKLIQFFNSFEKIDIHIDSLTQVITLMGRNKLLRWLLAYLYSEVSTKANSKTVLELAIRRAESMEHEADAKNKDKAYLAGMFSLLGSIFDTDIKELMQCVNMDREITMLVLHKKGIFAGSLMRAEVAEKNYLRKVMMANFEKLNTVDLIYTLEDGGVDLNKDDI